LIVGEGRQIRQVHDREENGSHGKSLGVPYTEEDIANAQASMLAQGTQIEKNLYNDPDFVASYEADKAAGGENFHRNAQS
jgi:cytochrome c oxidase cbb3-type subunit I/II